MARPNAPRSIGAEDNLADRIARERQLRGWSYETLAERMTNAGCSIQGSAIYKIEKGNPRRRITVDELLAFAKVFEVTLDNLLTPIDELDDAIARELQTAMMDRYSSLLNAAEEYVAVLGQVLTLHKDNRDVYDYIVGHTPSDSTPEEWADYRPWIKLRTGEPLDVNGATLMRGMRAFLDVLTEQSVELALARAKSDMINWDKAGVSHGER